MSQGQLWHGQLSVAKGNDRAKTLYEKFRFKVENEKQKTLRVNVGLLGPGHPPPFSTTSPANPGSWKKASGNFRKLLDVSGNFGKVSRHFRKVSRNFWKVSRNFRSLL